MFNNIYEKVKKFIKENFVFLLIMVAIFLVFNVELPYVIETPGGSIVLNDRIKVSDGYEMDGKLGMAYVSMVRGSIPFLLASYVIPNWDIIPKSDIKYDNESMNDANIRGKLQLDSAIDYATYIAFKEANKEIEIKNAYINVSRIAEEANTELKIGDIILEIKGEKVESFEDIKNIVSECEVDEIIKLKIIRDKKEKEVKTTIYNTEDGLKIGIGVIVTYDFEKNQEVYVDTKASESGPSGGMMMSLMIYNSLVEDDITKGRYIIGTGEIDMNGNVGAIGGVKYKIIGAERKKASVFLCPMDNLEEALEVKKEKKLKIEVVGVSTLRDAIDYLEE